MILTCPSCSASYNVPNDAIGVDGRTVRCKKCKHEWFQEGEKKALEDLIHLIQTTDIEVDDIAFDDVKKKPKIAPPPKAPKVKIKLSEKLANLLQKIIPVSLKNYLFSGNSRSLLSHCASFMVALAVFSCLVLVLTSARWSITHAMPSLTSVYEAAGFPLYNYARMNPEEALMIDRVLFESESGKRTIIGNLINITSHNIKVPPLKLDYLGESGNILHETTYVLPISILDKEISYGFQIPVADDIPQNFTSVKISFTEK